MRYVFSVRIYFAHKLLPHFTVQRYYCDLWILSVALNRENTHVYIIHFVVIKMSLVVIFVSFRRCRMLARFGMRITKTFVCYRSIKTRYSLPKSGQGRTSFFTLYENCTYFFFSFFFCFVIDSRAFWRRRPSKNGLWRYHYLVIAVCVFDDV